MAIAKGLRSISDPRRPLAVPRTVESCSEPGAACETVCAVHPARQPGRHGCNPPGTAPLTRGQTCSLVSPGCDSPGGDALVVLTSVTVSPTTVRAGDHFTPTATAAFGDWDSQGIISVDCADSAYWQASSAFTVSLTAVLNQTGAAFGAECDPAFAPSKIDTIQVGSLTLARQSPPSHGCSILNRVANARPG
jgi:hypothetical protein